MMIYVKVENMRISDLCIDPNTKTQLQAVLLSVKLTVMNDRLVLM